MNPKLLSVACLILPLMSLSAHSSAADSHATSILLETESFDQYGGWKLDTQFIDEMGSPYLLAHGIGRPVGDATTSVDFPQSGTYHIWARTKDWVARWDAAGDPGKFQIAVDGKTLPTVFGTQGKQWLWQSGGTVEITQPIGVPISLKDLTGFDGRCDAIYFSLDDKSPPEDKTLSDWRAKQLGVLAAPEVVDGYDLVVVGGGYSGMGAALSAARMGCKVALVQNRPVLGGNGSSEVRVWAMGNIRRGPYPRVGEIINEFADSASKSPGTYEEFGDDLKQQIIDAESNIDLFLNHHAFAATAEDEKVVSVTAFDTRTSARKEFRAPLFVDGTGHGTLGFLVEAQWEMTPGGRMGMSNMWAWDEQAATVEFPNTQDWALDLTMEDFPYPRDHHGQWFWESGFDKDPLYDAEGIRDWNLRAVFGAFNAMKNGDGADDHKTAFLTWVAYVGGTRESRRLIGDVHLTQEDIAKKRVFKDGCVPTTWSIDLHYPKEEYAKKFPDNPFISKAVHDRAIDRNIGYPVPYRCFYSKNIKNLFIVGRCASVTHEALGTVRVMKTCGMMGEVVGKAASICRLRDCSPREVYERYWEEMDKLLKLPGQAKRPTVRDAIVMPEQAGDIPPSAQRLKIAGGIAMDDSMAQNQGVWKNGQKIKGFHGKGYQYALAKTDASMRFLLRNKKSGKHDVRISWRPHENRASNAKVIVKFSDKQKDFSVDMRQAPNLKSSFQSIGEVTLEGRSRVEIIFDAKEADGVVCVDAVQLAPVK